MSIPKTTCVKISYGGGLRRVCVENISVKALRREIEKMFPEIPSGYLLKQRDNDGDLITIATDEDLNFAISECQKYLKLMVVLGSKNIRASSKYVQVRSNETKEQRSKSPPTTPLIRSETHPTRSQEPNSRRGGVRHRPMDYDDDFKKQVRPLHPAHHLGNQHHIYQQHRPQMVQTAAAAAAASNIYPGRGPSQHHHQAYQQQHHDHIHDSTTSPAPIPSSSYPVAIPYTSPLDHPQMMIQGGGPVGPSQPAIRISNPDTGVPHAEAISFRPDQTAVGGTTSVPTAAPALSSSSSGSFPSSCPLVNAAGNLRAGVAGLVKKTAEEVTKKGKELFTAWVGNVCDTVEGMQLKKYFQNRFPSVVSARVVKSRGYGFVEFESEEELHKAVQEMDGKTFIKCPLKVKLGNARKPSPPPGNRAGKSPSRRHRRAMSGGGGEGKNKAGASVPAKSLPKVEITEVREDDYPVVGEPGEIVSKTWVVQNSGDEPWPKLTFKFTENSCSKGKNKNQGVNNNTSGTGGGYSSNSEVVPSLEPIKKEIFVPALAPGKVAFVTVNFKLPKKCGMYESTFRAYCPGKQKWGPHFVGRIKVVEDLSKESADIDHTKQPDYYLKEVEALVAMGFGDEELCNHLIRETKGDLHMTAKWLAQHIGRPDDSTDKN